MNDEPSYLRKKSVACTLFQRFITSRSSWRREQTDFDLIARPVQSSLISRAPPIADLRSPSLSRLAMELHDVLPERFGFVIFTFVYSLAMLMYLAVKVGAARKKYDIKYPTMYSEKEQMFNCIQRAHQNTLEVYPQWLIFQTIAGLVYPTSASVLGVIWVTSRFSYAWGYYTGNPARRMNGAYGYVGFFGVVILSIAVALQLLRVF
ncbi:microsomal glutathione S-transferase 3b isoform X1 [Brienomyrus brachyistius]|uniref:microsomal glutathione S-transferase 3b isoform X1 n=2 Tax=Brienomyrus brachyistius TaxID=42636 RepID=UPI0020B35D51|nr:microsomal glutathione S-transferase 3b isoform X1 [Brienomyrus brachyistius]